MSRLAVFFISVCLAFVCVPVAFANVATTTTTAATTTTTGGTTTTTAAGTTTTTAAGTGTTAAGTGTTAAGTGTTAAGTGSTATTATSATTTAFTGSTPAPTTTPTVSSEATQVNAEFKLNIDYAAVTKTPEAAQKFKDDMKSSISRQTGATEDQIKNLGIRKGSVVVFFTIVVDSASKISPAEAVQTLKTKISSGTLAVNSTVVSSITVDTTYFKALEPTGYRCYSCNGTSACEAAQLDSSAVQSCSLSQTCWMQKHPFPKRFCGKSCKEDKYKDFKCTDPKTTCLKCCASEKCNKEALSSGQNLVVAPLLMSFAVLLQFLLSASL